MSKRPKIKGRGADIYLGGDSEQHSNLRRNKFAQTPVPATAQPEPKRDCRNDSGGPSCALAGLKRVVDFHIRNTAMLANQAIELQQQSTQWAKGTPLAAMFEVQASIAREIVERTAAAARNLWQIGD